jgi:predicted flap endonuclease-1-like 5' DNA nuclease
VPDDEQPSDDQQSDDLPAGLSAPARRALAGAGVTRLEDVAAFTETELMKLHGIGPKALQTLRRALAAKGMVISKSANARRLDKESLSRTRR